MKEEKPVLPSNTASIYTRGILFFLSLAQSQTQPGLKYASRAKALLSINHNSTDLKLYHSAMSTFSQ